MADSPISGLPAASTLSGTELVPVVQSGITKMVPAQEVADLGSGSINSVTGAGVNNTDPANPVVSPNIAQILANGSNLNYQQITSPSGEGFITADLANFVTAWIASGYYNSISVGQNSTKMYANGAGGNGKVEITDILTSIENLTKISLNAPSITASQDAVNSNEVTRWGQILSKVLLGLNITGGSINSSDTILQAFGKLQNQVNGVLYGATYQGSWNALSNTPSLTSGVGTKGHYYVVGTQGTTNIDGNTDWRIGDWIIFNGTTWDKVDNTDAVVSVNGFIGAVNLTTTDIPEVSNLYFTNARAIAALLTGYAKAAGTVAATDSILQAIQKLDGNLDLKADKTNSLVSGGAISIGTYGGTGTNNDIRVAVATWYVNGSNYSTAGNTDFLDITLSTAGNQRYIGLYGDTSNTITKVEGSEAAAATPPSTPANTALIGYVLVSDAGYAPTSNKATISDINTGTDDTKYITSLGLDGSKYVGQNSSKISATASGTNTYTATLTPAITAYTSTQRFKILFTNANTGASTLNLSGLGAKTLVKNNGAALVSGDIPAGSIWDVAYDGTNLRLMGMSLINNTVIAKSANFTVGATELGATYNVTTGSSTITATLPTAYNGWYFFIKKVDSGIGVIVTSTATVTCERQNQLIKVVYNGSAWEASTTEEGYIAPGTYMGNSSGSAGYASPQAAIDIHDSTQKAYNYDQNGFTKDWLSGVFYRQYKNKTVSNTTKATILSTTSGDYAGASSNALRVPANMLVAGKSIRIKTIGKYTSSSGSDTLLVEIKIGTVVLTSSTAITVGSTFTNVYFEINFDINIDAVGSSGSVIGLGKISFITSAGVTTNFPLMDTFSAKTLDTTINNDLDIQVQHSNASGSMTNINTTIERLA